MKSIKKVGENEMLQGENEMLQLIAVTFYEVQITVNLLIFLIFAEFITPAPNAYPLAQGQTAKGTSRGPNPTLKSRASPYVHSGLQTGKVLNEVECWMELAA